MESRLGEGASKYEGIWVLWESLQNKVSSSFKIAITWKNKLTGG